MITPNPGDDIPAPLHHGVVVVGNLDGVHLGHQALIAAAHDTAQNLGAPVIVLTFAPHPRRFFRPESAPFILTPPALQDERLAALGVAGAVRVAFDAAFSHLSADGFIQTVLKDRLKARAVVVGDDFHFGQGRTGSVHTLKSSGLDVTAVPLVCDHNGLPISSSRIRGCLEEGQIAAANALLGWDWALDGIVAHGDGRGRTLGYPTANIWMGDVQTPAHGIYAAWVTLSDGSRRKSAVSLGRRPMFAVPNPLLEAHLLDFDGDLYDQTLRIQLVQKIRDEARFDTLEALVTQMKKDCDLTRDLLNSGANSSP